MSDQPPNIIVILPHDLGRQLGCYGRGIHSPHLDRFAGEGMRFDNAFTNSPACSPSRGCLHTGQYAHTNGMMGLAHAGWPLADEVQTVVDAFNGAGWETVHTGLQHERLDVRKNRYQREFFEKSRGTGAEVAVTDALDYLRERTKGEGAPPFYMNIGTIEVHACKWGHDGEHNFRHRYNQVAADKVHLPNSVEDTPRARELLGWFEGAIEFFDEQIGRLLQGLEDFGFADNTLVVFTTDHGIVAPGGKGSLYDLGTEVSLMARLPGVVEAGSVSKELIQNIDIAPTLLEAAGIAIPKRMQGKSFWPRLTGKTYSPHEYIVTERNWHGDYHTGTFDPMRTVRTDDFHYIRHFDPENTKPYLRRFDEFRVGRRPEVPGLSNPWNDPLPPKEPEELYKVNEDPNETRNLAREERYAEVLTDMRTRLDDWMRATEDPILKGPIPLPHVDNPDDWGDCG